MWKTKKFILKISLKKKRKPTVFPVHCPNSVKSKSKFPRYNMKWKGKPDTTWNIPRSITFSPLHFISRKVAYLWDSVARRLPNKIERKVLYTVSLTSLFTLYVLFIFLKYGYFWQKHNFFNYIEEMSVSWFV